MRLIADRLQKHPTTVSTRTLATHTTSAAVVTRVAADSESDNAAKGSKQRQPDVTPPRDAPPAPPPLPSGWQPWQEPSSESSSVEPHTQYTPSAAAVKASDPPAGRHTASRSGAGGRGDLLPAAAAPGGQTVPATGKSTPDAASDDATRNELHLLAFLLLRPDWSMHAKLIERAYARDAELVHPLFVVTGRDAIVRVYETWSAVNARLSLTMHSIALTPHSAVLDLTQHVRLRFLPFLPIDFRMMVELDYVPASPHGGKVITRQRDIYPADSILRAIAPGRLVHDLVQAVGAALVYLLCWVIDLAPLETLRGLGRRLAGLPAAPDTAALGEGHPHVS